MQVLPLSRAIFGTLLGTTALLAATSTLPFVGSAQQASSYTVPRTPWGDPDLQGKWPGTEMVGVPMQRDEKLGLRNELTDEEFADRERRAVLQEEADNADFSLETSGSTPGGDVGGPVSPPPHWVERGEPQRQASLIVDPPNGRMPPFTQAAQDRQAELRALRQTRGPAESYTDRSNYDRCITRGLAGSILPVIYNNGTQIFQAPGFVAIVNEMIHETRIVPLDGRPHASFAIKMWLGDSRGRFEGDTLVVETTNFTDRTGVGVNGGGQRHSEALKITERYTRIADDVIDYKMTVEDPETWTAPWTMEFPLKRDDGYGMFEYACHEGNLAMFNILSGARADDRKAAGSR
ncbi:MAG TPA: hypothetical protein VM692_15310 [Gammaproteobacteria bacterium]|nr:hypothetical protein [Gammaproteobacteria bacterium]